MQRLLTFSLRLAFFASLPGLAQLPLLEKSRSEPIATPKVFVGLSHGNLQSDGEKHLRPFIRLRRLIGEIRNDLLDSKTTIVVGDLERWEDESEDWKLLARQGYTYYLVAVPDAFPINEVHVTWFAGKFAGENRALQATLRRHTRISVPERGQEAKILEVGTRVSQEADKRDESDDIADTFRLLFPNLMTEHWYFVECFDNRVKTVPELRQAHSVITVHLSSNLQTSAWRPKWPFSSTDSLADICKGAAYTKDERYTTADLLIRGTISDDLHRAVQNKRRFRPHILLEDHVPDKRRKFAIIRQDVEAGSPLRELKDLCIDNTMPFSALENLAHYIQARGFNVPDVTYDKTPDCK